LFIPIPRPRFTTYTYAIDGNVLTLKKADGEVIRWKKM